MTVQEEVRQRIERDALLAKLRGKIGSGKATYADTAAYSNRAGKLLGEIFSRRLPDIPLSDREALCAELLHDRYTDINALCDAVQEALDKAQGLHLRPQHAPFDTKRAHQIGGSTVDPTKPEDVRQRRARAATETMTKSMHDDRMKAEAKFRHRAGLDCRITRVAVNGCCPWCSDVAGRYRYGEEPEGIYKRHDNCDCTVIFENGRKRQDVWSKREWEAPEPGAGAGDPVVLTKEQSAVAGADEPINFIGKEAPQNDLTADKKRSIMKAITIQDINDSDPSGIIDDECRKKIAETLKSQGVSYVYDKVVLFSKPRDEDGKIEPLITDAIATPGYPEVVLRINIDFFAGRSLEKIDEMFRLQKYSVAKSLEEAVIHECAHAKMLKGITYARYEAIDQELNGEFFTKPIKERKDKKSLKDLAGGLSEYAQTDCLDCIAESHVVLHRGSALPKELKDLHDAYVR